MTTQQQILDFYSRPAGMTSASEFAPLLDQLPNDAGALVRIVQGLGVYDVVDEMRYRIVWLTIKPIVVPAAQP